jgi:hypothetical protein
MNSKTPIKCARSDCGMGAVHCEPGVKPCGKILSPQCQCGHAWHLHSGNKGCRAIYKHLPEALEFMYGKHINEDRMAVCQCAEFKEVT